VPWRRWGCFTPCRITSYPPSQAVLLGSTASLSITTTGTVSDCQWLLNGAPLSDNAHISGSATPTLTINNVQFGDAADMLRWPPTPSVPREPDGLVDARRASWLRPSDM